MYGRRRIGKTFLIYEFFRHKGVYFEVTGVKKASKKDQLNRFYKSFVSKFQIGDLKKPEEWADAFDLIKSVITMITPFGVVKNEHYLGLVDQQLTMEDLF